LVVEPVITIFKAAAISNFLIFVPANFASVAFVLNASFYRALLSFQLVMIHTIDAFSSEVSQAAISHFFTIFIFSQVKSTLAGSASIVV
jgi:hypothetical protein